LTNAAFSGLDFFSLLFDASFPPFVPLPSQTSASIVVFCRRICVRLPSHRGGASTFLLTPFLPCFGFQAPRTGFFGKSSRVAFYAFVDVEAPLLGRPCSSPKDFPLRIFPRAAHCIELMTLFFVPPAPLVRAGLQLLCCFSPIIFSPLVEGSPLGFRPGDPPSVFFSGLRPVSFGSHTPFPKSSRAIALSLHAGQSF